MIQCSETAEVSFQEGWFQGKLRVRTHSVRAVANIPSADRGSLVLRVASRDAAAARALADDLQRSLGGPAVDHVARDLVALKEPVKAIDAADTPDAKVTMFHPGLLLMGLVILAIGVVLMTLLPQLDRDEMFFIGMGLVLGGGAMASGAFSNKERAGWHMCGPNPSTLVMGTVMAVLGTAMFTMGVMHDEEGFLWPGFGIMLGSSGCWCGSWQAYAQPRRYRLNDAAAALLVMGVVMVSLGTYVFVMAWRGDWEREFAYIGMGIILGGGGCWSGIWKNEKRANSQ